MTLRTITALLLFAAASARADLAVDPGITEVIAGTPSVDIPIAVVGGDEISDMVGAVQIVGAEITTVSYTGSVWESAPGGFLDFYIGFAPTGATVDPNASLLSPGQTVTGNGTLFTISVDTSTLAASDYPIKLAITPAGDTKLTTTGGAPITTNLLTGTLRVLEKPLLAWRADNFPADVGNALLEDTVWGDTADPDADGIHNLLEFAFALPPNQADHTATGTDTPGLPTLLTVDDGGDTFLAIRYTRRLDTTCHSVVAETSSDLVSWDDTGADLTPVGPPVAHANGVTESVTERLTTSSPTRQFLRITVTNLAP